VTVAATERRAWTRTQGWSWGNGRRKLLGNIGWIIAGHNQEEESIRTTCWDKTGTGIESRMDGDTLFSRKLEVAWRKNSKRNAAVFVERQEIPCNRCSTRLEAENQWTAFKCVRDHRAGQRAVEDTYVMCRYLVREEMLHKVVKQYWWLTIYRNFNDWVKSSEQCEIKAPLQYDVPIKNQTVIPWC